jgi:dCTP deaminase
MTILSYQSIKNRYGLIQPMEERTLHAQSGMTYGLSSCGYDLRIDQDVYLAPGEFALASTVEMFNMPDDLAGIVHDKSSLARRGIALQNTVIEPGWRGYLTLELSNHGWNPVQFYQGMPIAQVIFHVLDYPTHRPYEGKYQDQLRGPQEAI